MKVSAIALSLGLAAAVPVAAGAQTAADINNQVTTMDSSTSNHGQTQVIGKISNDFSSFLGADANAVITGLRNGTPISLTSTTAPTTPGVLPMTNTTVITPPTGQMGFGEVYISLALAKQQLSTMGITEPTPEQLQAALTGGEVTYTTESGVTTTQKLDGILTMRSDGMGYGQIAKQLDTKLGPVMAGMKSANKNFAAGAAASSTKTAAVTKANGTSSSQGKSSPTSSIVSGSGKAHGGTASTVSAVKGSGRGIVSAAGKGNGHAYGYSSRSGIVTGSGSAAGSNSGIVSAGSPGKGMAQGKGHNK